MEAVFFKLIIFATLTIISTINNSSYIPPYCFVDKIHMLRIFWSNVKDKFRVIYIYSSSPLLLVLQLLPSYLKKKSIFSVTKMFNFVTFQTYREADRVHAINYFLF